MGDRDLEMTLMRVHPSTRSYVRVAPTRCGSVASTLKQS
jgi:hypothetical protein